MLRLTGATALGDQTLALGDQTLALGDQTLALDGDLVLDDGRIVSSMSDEPASVSGSARIDASGLVVAPGFVDVQINGGFGFDLQSNPASMWDLGRALPETGVTSFLPTLISSAPDDEQAMLAAFASRPGGYVGAEPIGLHFEGPMLNPERSGAHRVRSLRPPSMETIAGWHRDVGVRLVTLAPELEGALDVISELDRRGITTSAGHSSATMDETGQAIEAGLRGVTHLFNAMTPMSHRSPNLVGAALTSPALNPSVIVDGVHVDPTVVRLAWRSIGAERFVLVTDAVAPMGQPPGEFAFDRGVVVSDGDSVRNSRGVLAGSALTMRQAVNNLRSFSDCTLAQALAAATRNPADLIGEPARRDLSVDSVADLVLLDDALNEAGEVDPNEPGKDGVRVVITICGGDVAYIAPDHRWRFTGVDPETA